MEDDAIVLLKLEPWAVVVASRQACDTSVIHSKYQMKMQNVTIPR